MIDLVTVIGFIVGVIGAHITEDRIPHTISKLPWNDSDANEEGFITPNIK